MAGSSGASNESDPGIELGRAHEFGVVDVHVAHNEDLPGTFAAHGAARGHRAWSPNGALLACRITSGSSALSSTSERVTSVSPWLMVTVELATERPLCMRSTAISRGASGDAPRANTVWMV